MKNKISTKRGATIFRALANENRLKIIKMLWDGREINVGDIASELRISLKATSNHLAILKNLDVLEARGTAGHVFYSVNKRMPDDFRRAIGVL